MLLCWAIPGRFKPHRMDRIDDIQWRVLCACPLFRGIPPPELRQLLEKANCRSRAYKKDEGVALAGQTPRFLHIVIRGSVRGEMLDFTGRVIKIEDIPPPRPLAAAFLFGEQDRYPVNIIANESTLLISIPRDRLTAMMQDNRIFLTNFLNAISSRSQFLSGKIRYLSFGTIKGKLAQYLLEQEKKQGGEGLTMLHSQASLSELFGVTRPSVGRAMSELNQEGIIRSEGKKVYLLDRVRLKDLIK